MNIHHLELFYYVAKHGGISGAVRNIPYGIQQPAMSSQVIQLEEFLGAPLFLRRPFSLTPAGLELYQFIKPFFDEVGPMADKIRGGVAQHIRIGASGIVLRNYLPGILQAVERKFPRLKLTLREGYQADLESLVQQHELDLAITILENIGPPGASTLPLFPLPLILLVPQQSPFQSAGDLLQPQRQPLPHTLISLPVNESIYKNFQKGLARLNLEWTTKIEVNSVDLVETYVRRGFGIGLSVSIPKAGTSPGLRALPLDKNFAPVNLGVLFQGKPTPVMNAFLETVQEAAQHLVPSSPRSRKPRKS